MVIEPNCETEKVSALVASIVSGSEINRIHGKELDITLPYDGVAKFSGREYIYSFNMTDIKYLVYTNLF